MRLPGLPDLQRRSNEPELLDTGVPEAEIPHNLADLRLVNRWLGARRRLLAAVQPHLGPGGALLDVGCGSADQPAFLLARLPPSVFAAGLDVKLAHLRDVPAGVHPVVADVRALPFPESAFDVVTASLFLHHFDDVVPVLRRLYGLCRRALVVSDLHRAAVPHLLGQVAFPLIFRSAVSVHDGLVSIRRGFRPAELRAAFEEAGIADVRLQRCFPYRLLAVAARAREP